MSKSFLRIPDFPYFGVKIIYNSKNKPIPVTPEEVKEILLDCKWKDTIFLYQEALPQLVRNSKTSDTCTVFFNIYDSRRGQHLRSLKGRHIMYGDKRLTILPTDKRIGVPICPQCWRLGHHSVVCPFKTQLCCICSRPHESKHHRVLGACCKAAPMATPPRLATPAGHPCPHPSWCVNCSLAYNSDSQDCSFWKHR